MPSYNKGNKSGSEQSKAGQSQSGQQNKTGAKPGQSSSSSSSKNAHASKDTLKQGAQSWSKEKPMNQDKTT